MKVNINHCVSVVNVLLFVIAEAAAQILNLTALNNSEVMTTCDVNPDFFELSFFNVTYFIKPEQEETQIVTDNTYQISDLIPGETYTIRVTAVYSEITGSRVFSADVTQGTVTLERIGIVPLIVDKPHVMPVCAW